jgi:site-specific DNA-methyltransferase (adenine-specific)
MIQLYKGDCLIESDKIENGSVDLILTDLPYGTVEGIGNGEIIQHGMKGKTGWDNIIDTEKIMLIANRILRRNGKLILFAQQPFTTELINKAIPSIPHSYNMIWEKDHFANALTAKKAPLNYYEDVLIFSKTHNKNEVFKTDEVRDYFKAERKKINASLTEINRVAFDDKSGKDGMAGNVLSSYKKGWTFPTEERYNKLNNIYGICTEPYLKLKEKSDKLRTEYIESEITKLPVVFNLWEGNKYKSNILKYKKDYDGLHPTQKPILLLEDLIKTFSNEGNLVVDLTMGSGSTGVACKNTKRNFIGIEMDDKYFEIAEKRIKEAQINTIDLFNAY